MRNRDIKTIDADDKTGEKDSDYSHLHIVSVLKCQFTYNRPCDAYEQGNCHQNYITFLMFYKHNFVLLFCVK